MFGLFKKKSWENDVVPTLSAENDKMSVMFLAFPCLKNPASGKRKVHDDYGPALLEVFNAFFGDQEQAKGLFSQGGGTVKIMLNKDEALRRAVPDVTEGHTLTLNLKQRTLVEDRNTYEMFFSDVLDTCIEAFEKL